MNAEATGALRARPDLACRVLAARAASAAKRTTGRPWNVEASPTLSGDIAFRFSSDAGHVTFTWGEDGGFRFSRLAGSIAITDLELPRRGFERLLCKTLAWVLVDATARESFSHLAPIDAPGAEPELRVADAFSESAAERLARDWFPVDEAGWHTYRVRRTESTPVGLSLVCSDGARDVVLWIGRERSLPPSERGARAREPVLVRGGLAVAVVSDGRTQEERADPAHEVERIATLALARTVRREAERPRPASAGIEGPLDPGGHPDWDFFAPVYGLPASLRWRQFMAEGLVNQAGGYGFLDAPQTVVLDYSDRACSHMRALTNDAVPLLHCVRVDFPERTPAVRAIVDPAELVSTGGEETLRQGLRDVVEAAGGRLAITMRKTCALMLVGTDTEPICSACEREHGVAIGRFQPDGTFVSPHRSAGLLLGSLLSTSTARERTTGPSVSLVWFERESERRELALLLSEMGIDVAGCLLPALGPDDIARFRSGWVQVFPQSDVFERELAAVLDGTGLGSITPPGAYGLRATSTWLERVASEVGRADAWTAWHDRTRARLDATILRWRERSRGLGLAFVVDPRQLPRIWDPRRNCGLSYLRVLREFGFRVLAFVYADPRSAPAASHQDRVAADLVAKGFEKTDLELAFFSTRDELTTLLGAESHAAVFTDYTADTRLEAAGKAWFSASDFEKGIDGAERTFERLLRRVETSFLCRRRAAG